jgi:fatty-acyl-CoA synthase
MVVESATMGVMDKAAAMRRAASALRFRVATVARVGVQTGLLRSVRLPGALVLLRELPKGRPSPSLIYRYQAKNDPHRTALIWVGRRGDRAYSYFEMDAQIDRIAAALARRGIGAGSSVLIMLKNRPELLMLQSGIGRLGASAVSVSYRSTPLELEYIAAHSGASAIFVDSDVAPSVEIALDQFTGPLAANVVVVGDRVSGATSFEEFLDGVSVGDAPVDRGDEAAVVTYTSGTTGKPKGAVRKFPRDMLASALAFIGETPMNVNDVHLAVCPLYHATAFGFVALSLVVGSTIVLMEEFKPESFLAAIERYRVTTTAVVPTMLHRVLSLEPEILGRYDTSSLHAVFTGGAPLPGPVGQAFMDRFGDKLFNFYGATETGLVTLAKPSDLRRHPGTIGRLVPGHEIRLVREDGSDARDNEVGELYARSSMLVEGYHADPEATKASMSEGYFSVGDLARVDEQGYYFLEGRKRDMIISGGVNVYPAEVEAAIEAHGEVAEVAVIGVADREWGERVRAFVVRKANANLDQADLIVHCRSRLAGPKIPRDWIFLDVLPRNPTGKVLKRELRDYDAGAGGPS